LHSRSALEQTYYQSLGYNISLRWFRTKKADGVCKNEYHSKYHSEGRRNDGVLKIDDKMNIVTGTKQESGNENKTK